MATKASRSSARLMISPAVILLRGWMLVPLCMTVYFSFLYYNLLQPGTTSFAGWDNYYWFITDPSFTDAIKNTLFLVAGVLFITTIGGIGAALLLDKPMFGQGLIRIMVIAPFFVMPTVSALVWKNMFMNPVNGIFGQIVTGFGFPPIDFFGQYPLASITFIVSWMWLPFATLILLTASLWFTPDNLAVVLAHLAQLYFSVFLLFLFGNMWSIRGNSNELVSKLANLSLLPLLIATVGGTLTFLVNPIWGISSLLFAVYTSRHIKYITSIYSALDKNYVDLINKISIILCICLMLILVFWLNPYTNPIEIYY